jgi:hypothetical protein
VQARAGDIEKGEALLSEAQEYFTLLAHDADLELADLRLAECRLLAGDFEGACDRARALADRADEAIRPGAFRCCGLARRDLGDLAGARAWFERSRAAALEAGEDYELACTLAVLAPLVAAENADVAVALRSEAGTLLARFGVVRLPSWAGEIDVVSV